MKDLLCFSVDTESDEGEPIAERFNVRGLPKLLFLDPDGTLRDSIGGYMPPAPFLKEVQRIKRNEGTFSGLRAGIAANPDDLDLRLAFAKKCRGAGDEDEYDAQVAEIRKRDPEGKSLASRTLRLDEILDARMPDVDQLKAFLATENDPGLLFQGWFITFQVLGFQMSREGDPDVGAKLRTQWLAAARATWKHVPEDRHGDVGNRLAWSLYENRDSLTTETMNFAVSIARQAVAAAGEEAGVIDTLACCLHAAGKTEEALVLVRRCIELEPDNAEWKQRLKAFGG